MREQYLNRRLGGLCILHELYNFGKRGLSANLSGLNMYNTLKYR